MTWINASLKWEDGVGMRRGEKIVVARTANPRLREGKHQKRWRGCSGRMQLTIQYQLKWVNLKKVKGTVGSSSSFLGRYIGAFSSESHCCRQRSRASCPSPLTESKVDNESGLRESIPCEAVLRIFYSEFRKRSFLGQYNRVPWAHQCILGSPCRSCRGMEELLMVVVHHYQPIPSIYAYINYYYITTKQFFPLRFHFDKYENFGRVIMKSISIPQFCTQVYCNH